MKETDKNGEELPIIAGLAKLIIDSFNNFHPKEDDDKEFAGMTTLERLQAKTTRFCQDIIGTRPFFWLVDYAPLTNPVGEFYDNIKGRLCVDVFCRNSTVDLEDEYDDVYTQVIAALCSCLRTCYSTDLPKVLLLPIPKAGNNPQGFSYTWQRAMDNINLICRTRRDGYDAIQWNATQAIRALENGEGILNPIIKYDTDIIQPHTPVVLLDTLNNGSDAAEIADEIEAQTNCCVLGTFSLARLDDGTA